MIYSQPMFVSSTFLIFFSPKLSQKAAYLNYAMRSLEMTPSDALLFYIPQIVQILRHDPLGIKNLLNSFHHPVGYIERTVMHIAKISSLFAHQIIWNLTANTFIDDTVTIVRCKNI